MEEKDFELPDFNDDKVTRLKKKIDNINKQIEQEKEKKSVKEYTKSVNSNPIIKRNGKVLVSRKGYLFWISFAIFWSIILLGIGGYLFYLGNTGHLDLNGLVRPVFNNQVTNNNNFTFNSTIHNDYQNDVDARDYDTINVNNNFTIKFCNGTGC